MSSRPLDQSAAEPAGAPGPMTGARQGIVILAAWLSYSLFRIALLGAALPAGRTPLWVRAVGVVAIGIFWALATPGVFALTRWLRKRALGRARTIALHTLAGLLLAWGVTLVRQGVMHAFDDSWPIMYFTALIPSLDYHLITYAMLVIVGTALEGHREYAESGRREIALTTRLAEARLQFLQRQLQPHFLFNALNTIAELTRETPDAARRTLLDLARLLRAAVAHVDDPEVSLREELATLEPFVEIQRVRFSDSLDIRFSVAAEALDACVPPMLLQPLVENAVLHGRHAHGGAGRVLVTARKARDRLVIRVLDAGPQGARHPFPAKSHKSGRGIGLRNTKERLAQLYGDDHTFLLRSERGRATVAELNIPYRTSMLARRGLVAESIFPHPAHRMLRSGPHGPELHAPVTAAAADLIALTTGAPPVASGPTVAPDAPLSARAWGGMILFWVACAAWWTTQTAASYWLESRTSVPLAVTLGELVSALVWVGLTPVVLWLARTVPLHRGRLVPDLLLHTVAAMVLGALHVAITLSIGVADRPLLIAGNIQFYTLDLFIYAALLAWWHARAFSAWYHARAVAAARTEAQIARSRLEATALGLHAPFLLGVLDFAADLAMVDPERAERVVERLADLLRAMLYSVGDGARTVREELVLLQYCLDVHEALTGSPAALHDDLGAAILDAYVSPGVAHAVMEYVLARALEVPDQPLRLHASVDAPGRTLVVRIDHSVFTIVRATGESLPAPRSA